MIDRVYLRFTVNSANQTNYLYIAPPSPDKLAIDILRLRRNGLRYMYVKYIYLKTVKGSFPHLNVSG